MIGAVCKKNIFTSILRVFIENIETEVLIHLYNQNMKNLFLIYEINEENISLYLSYLNLMVQKLIATSLQTLILNRISKDDV